MAPSYTSTRAQLILECIQGTNQLFSENADSNDCIWPFNDIIRIKKNEVKLILYSFTPYDNSFH